MLYAVCSFVFQMTNYRTVLDLEIKIVQDGNILLSKQRTPAQILRVPSIIPYMSPRLLISCIQLLTRYFWIMLTRYFWIMLITNNFIHKYMSEVCSMKFSEEKSHIIAAVGFVFIFTQLTTFDCLHYCQSFSFLCKTDNYTYFGLPYFLLELYGLY
jgi:hypothetical protein